MTTEFDRVFNQMEASEYPATCDNCGETGTNATMEQHECSTEQPRPEQAAGESSVPSRLSLTNDYEGVLTEREHDDAPAAPERGEHSPLPWSIKDGPSGYADESADSHYTIIAADSFSIAVMVNDCVPPERGNAELIVRAVNQHSILIEQREQLAEFVRQFAVKGCTLMGQTCIQRKLTQLCARCRASQLLTAIDSSTTTGREG